MPFELVGVAGVVLASSGAGASASPSDDASAVELGPSESGELELLASPVVLAADGPGPESVTPLGVVETSGLDGASLLELGLPGTLADEGFGELLSDGAEGVASALPAPIADASLSRESFAAVLVDVEPSSPQATARANGSTNQTKLR